jgi:hypothetical protein
MRKSSLILLLATTGLASAHDLHTSTGEAEFKDAPPRIEVSLTLFADDLELALMRRTERFLRFGTTPAAELDKVLKTYITEHFIVHTAEGVRPPIKWIGHEAPAASQKTADPETTLYFEVLLPDASTPCSLRHDLLVEMFKDQEHLLRVKDGAASTSLRFSPGNDEQPLRRK